jgi:acetoin utilization protein AcuB
VQIKDILIPGLKTISVEATMVDAERILKENNFRHLPVTDGKRLVGILSDRDVQRAMTVFFSTDNRPQGHIQRHKKVTEYMSSPVHKMKHTDRLELLVREMINRKVSCYIIEDAATGDDLGIITTEDLMILLLDLLEARTGPFQILKRILRPVVR